MGYRDDLGQAHERIDSLEAQLRDERAKAAPTAPEPARVPSLALAFIAAGVVVGAGVAVVLLRARPPSDVILVQPVDEVGRDQARYRHRRMRVQGELVPGSVSMRSEPCEVTMVIERNKVLLSVHQAHCSLPGLFRADASVSLTAEGELREDGVFEAAQILVPTPKL